VGSCGLDSTVKVGSLAGSCELDDKIWRSKKAGNLLTSSFPRRTLLQGVS